jgi:membrane protein DedA with SNARE-associated domain
MDTNFFIEILTLYQMPALFLGSFLFGETVILAAAVLSAQGLWSTWTIFWLSLLGTLASDALWFLYGQKILSFFHRWEKYRRGSEKFLRSLEKLTGARPHLSLLWVKAVYGVRIFTIIYLSMRKVDFWKFIILDAIGSAWWLGVIILFGRVAGTGLDNLPVSIDNLEYAAAAIVLIIIVWRTTFTWISKRAIREIEAE